MRFEYSRSTRLLAGFYRRRSAPLPMSVTAGGRTIGVVGTKEVRIVIVVGVDGSKSSRDAIRWAVEEARLRKTTVQALYAWQGPPVVGMGLRPT